LSENPLFQRVFSIINYLSNSSLIPGISARGNKKIFFL